MAILIGTVAIAGRTTEALREPIRETDTALIIAVLIHSARAANEALQRRERSAIGTARTTIIAGLGTGS